MSWEVGVLPTHNEDSRFASWGFEGLGCRVEVVEFRVQG